MEYFSNDNLNTQKTENNKTTENLENPDNKTNENLEIPGNEKDTENFGYSGNNYGNSSKPFPNVFALFAKSLGTFSIFCAVFGVFFGAFICGGLAIILAVLSKGYDIKMVKNAKTGLITGIIGIILQIFVLAFSAYSIIHIPEFREQLNTLYEQMYGEPMDDSINQMLDDLKLPSEEGGFL